MVLLAGADREFGEFVHNQMTNGLVQNVKACSYLHQAESASTVMYLYTAVCSRPDIHLFQTLTLEMSLSHSWESSRTGYSLFCGVISDEFDHILLV